MLFIFLLLISLVNKQLIFSEQKHSLWWNTWVCSCDKNIHSLIVSSYIRWADHPHNSYTDHHLADHPQPSHHHLAMFLTKAAAIILIISAATARQSQPFTPRPRFYDEFTTGDDNRGNNLGKLSQLQLNHSTTSISNADKKVTLCTTTSSSPDYYPTFSLQNPFFAKKKQSPIR